MGKRRRSNYDDEMYQEAQNLYGTKKRKGIKITSKNLYDAIENANLSHAEKQQVEDILSGRVKAVQSELAGKLQQGMRKTLSD